MLLNFTDTSGQAAPTSQGYGVTVSNQMTFTVNAPQLLTGTYTETNGLITATISGNGTAFLYFKGFHALQTHRLAHWMWRGGERDFPRHKQH